MHFALLIRLVVLSLVLLEVELPARPSFALAFLGTVVFRVRLHYTDIYPCVFVELLQVQDEVRAVRKRAEEPDIQMIAVLLGLEGAVGGDDAVERVVWTGVPALGWVEAWCAVGRHGARCHEC